MKKTASLFIALMIAAAASAQSTQPDTTKKEFTNIIELDATALLHQFVSAGTNSSYYDQLYMISYKHIFHKNNAFRVGLGGSSYNNTNKLNDTITNSSKRAAVNIGIGLEHYFYLGKRWNFFTGGDVIASYAELNNLQTNSTVSSYKEKQVTTSIGIMPFLGIQFKINQRLSVSTEASCSLTSMQGTDNRDETPHAEYDSHIKTHGFDVHFNAPIGINFRINF